MAHDPNPTTTSLSDLTSFYASFTGQLLASKEDAKQRALLPFEQYSATSQERVKIESAFESLYLKISVDMAKALMPMVTKTAFESDGGIQDDDSGIKQNSTFVPESDEKETVNLQEEPMDLTVQVGKFVSLNQVCFARVSIFE